MKNLLYIFTIIVFLSSCEDFLNADPKGVIIPNTVEDYDLMLGGLNHIVGTDFVNLNPEVSALKSVQISGNTYTWQDEIFLEEQSDKTYNTLYSNIYIYNEIINNIDDAPGVATNKVRSNIKAQALASRAADYFLLVNYYGKHYNSKTKDSDLTVPLILVNDINQKASNSTVGEVYKQILLDLESAESEIGNFIPTDPRRPSLAGVYGLMSKVYLYMGMYNLAYDYASKSLDLNSTLVDMSDCKKNDLYIYYKNPENIWYRGNLYYNLALTLGYSKELLQLYDKDNDYRFVIFSNTQDSYEPGEYAYKIDGSYIPEKSILLSTPEVILIKAEAAIRENKISEAMLLIDQLQAKRIKNNSNNSANNVSDALEIVKKERQRELAFTGNYWFDLKRYYNEGRDIPTFKRILDGNTYSLEPGSSKYIINISNNVRNLNSNIKSIK